MAKSRPRQKQPEIPEKIRIGTMVNAHVGIGAADYIRQILPQGFESFELTFGNSAVGIDLRKLAKELREALDGSGAVISALGVYGNPLDPAAKNYSQTKQSWRKLIDAAPLFGCDLVCGFTGRVIDKPIDASLKAYAKFFGPLAKRAADKGVRIAFENCEMGGDWARGNWNIAHTPDCWELMFNELPARNIGLEWEPCHQMVKLIDPLPQLRKWVGKIFHIHGKDATVLWDVVKTHGVRGPVRFAFHRTPGFGDSNWTDIISELRRGGFSGAIDIEGWHDPVYRGEFELTGQVHGLNYLKSCRGGSFVPNPS